MKLYVNIRRPRIDAVLTLDIDIEKEACNVFLHEKCPVCIGMGCEFAQGGECPTKTFSNVVHADIPGQIITKVERDEFVTHLGHEGVNLVKNIFSGTFGINT